MLKLCLFEYIFKEELFEKAIFIQNGFLFEKKVLEIDEGIGTGYEIHTRTEGYEQTKLEFMRGIKPPSDADDRHIKPSVDQIDFTLPLVIPDSKWACSIKIRSELVFSGFLKSSKSSNDGGVALLIPVKNENEKLNECALMKYLIPSVLETTNEDEKEMITLFVGYDRDDPLFKDQFGREQVRKLSNLKIQFYELPKTGWLTFIWNYLFVEAYREGKDYFIQLNDDVQFIKGDWLTNSISMLPRSDKGVIGFNDLTWQCKLYTQTLVNRNHYKIFGGQYFPLSLRNWYSDNWITAAYQDRGDRCNEQAVIQNGNVQTRYDKCDARNYELVLKEGMKKII